jgi:outer membrane murein-binding lipoprotein Lpp
MGPSRMRLTSPKTIAWTATAIALCGVLAGCLGRRSVDLLEARLREQEDEIASLRQQVEHSQSELIAARRLNGSLNQQLASEGKPVDSVALAERQFRVTGLKINSLQTGGIDRDAVPGDDELIVVVTPHDNRGEAVRAPGIVTCVLLDAALPAEQQQLGVWSFNEQQTHDAWQPVLVGSGYRFELPWQTPPTSRELKLNVKFRSSHGDRFETSGRVIITPP